MSRQEIAAALGGPIYGVLGLEPESSYGSGGASNPTRLRLNFGPGSLLAVETSLQPIDAQTMLRSLGPEIASSLDVLEFPLTIEEHDAMLLVDGEYVEFKVLSVGEDLWFAAAEVESRWISVRGRGMPLRNFAVYPVDPTKWQRP
jgi:hypothetical protein